MIRIMRTIKISLPLALLFLLSGHCKQIYNSPYVSPHTGYLVVEGYISGNTSTQFRLSRTIPLPGDSTIPMETNAQVQVEGSDNSIYPLPQQGNGIYGVDTLTLNPGAQYRLRINTVGGETYLSDYAPFRPTPAIDSINWNLEDSGGVDIYANTHDPTNSTHYYQWQFDETWEYHSAEDSYYKYRGDTTPVMVVPRLPSEHFYRCWHEGASTNILLGNSTKLSQDVIYRQQLNHISPGDQRLSVLYSILVRQYALTEDGYNFLTLMQKNTESLGSIFDVQPSETKGNIHCLTNPAEPVIGYVSAGTVQQQRIFINRTQLPKWNYYYNCENPDRSTPNIPDSIMALFGPNGGQTPVSVSLGPSVVWYNETYCLDCRQQGGSLLKPAFWPY
jgi:hypothetical protein